MRNGVIGDYNINLSPQVFSMLVECPDCDEQLEIESGEGTLFECPSCGLDFEVDLPESNDFLHSENYWGLVLDSQVCYAEKLTYIRSSDGELPLERFIPLDSGGGEFNWGYLVWGAVVFVGISLIMAYLIHLVLNLNRRHKLFFWNQSKWERYFDAEEKVVLCLTQYRNGWFPYELSFVKNKTLFVEQTKIDLSHEDRRVIYRYVVRVNNEQEVNFYDEGQAKNFIFLVNEYQ